MLAAFHFQSHHLCLASAMAVVQSFGSVVPICFAWLLALVLLFVQVVFLISFLEQLVEELIAFVEQLVSLLLEPVVEVELVD